MFIYTVLLYYRISTLFYDDVQVVTAVNLFGRLISDGSRIIAIRILLCMSYYGLC